MANGAPDDDTGEDIEVTDAEDRYMASSYGGTINDWLPLENMLMRRRITHVLLAALFLALVVCGLLAWKGVGATVLMAIVILVATPLGYTLRYYFRQTGQ